MLKLKVIAYLFTSIILLTFLGCSKNEDDIFNAEETGRIVSFVIKADINTNLLLSDIDGLVMGDSVIILRVPYLLESKKLSPTIDFRGKGSLILRGDKKLPLSSMTDFSKEVFYDVIDEGSGNVLKSYKARLTSFTGLPVMNIYTEGNVAITSKTEYFDATINCYNNPPSHTDFNFPLTSVKIRGRGNSTWDNMPKKPYKLKFENKIHLFNESEGKTWVLLANYADKTAIRNALAFKMSEMSNLTWTPCSHFVELFINDKYQGNYQLTEQIKIAKDRVYLPDGGMILEIDHPTRVDEDDVYFNTDKLLLVIKDPDVKAGSSEYVWAKETMNKIENALFSDDFLVGGGRKYIDYESFADWYLVNEITKNKDANFFLSCFMTIAPNEKLKMGPVWDFDLAFGNYDWADYMLPEGFWVRNCDWLMRLFEDPDFVRLVRMRFEYFYARKEELFTFINEQANYLEDSMVENNNIWGTLYNVTWPNYAVRGTYQNEVAYLKSFLYKRLNWLDANLPR